MSDTKISNLTELSESPAATDEFVIVDKSDTTQASSGTTKKVQAQYVTPSEITRASASTQTKFCFSEDTDNGTNQITLTIPSSIASDKTITLPDTAGTVALTSDIPSFAPPNLLKNGNFINNSTNGYGGTPDDWVSSNANPVQGGIPALTKQNLIDMIGVADGNIEGLWPLNEASGNAIDLSSNGYNLTDTNTVGSSSDGLMALARDFEVANSEYFTISNASSANIPRSTGSFTFFCFIKPETCNTQVGIMGMSNTGANFRGFHFSGTTQKVSFLVDNDMATGNITSNVITSVGKWSLLVGTYDGTNISIWINGIKKTVAKSGTPGTNTSAFEIGTISGIGSYDGLIQNACVLSVALTDNQVKKLFAGTLYKGVKLRRATTNAIEYEDLPMNVVESLRGKTVALRADMYQAVASTGQISILQTLADGSTDETIISATDATTGSWLSKFATGTISASCVGIRVQKKVSTSDGNVWFKNVSLYEGSTLLPYDHSKDDWSRFPRLLRMDIPAVISGYQFEENRWYSFTPKISVSGGTAPTYTATFISRFKIVGKSAEYSIDWVNNSGGTAGAGAGALYFTLPVIYAVANISDYRTPLGFAFCHESSGTIIFSIVTPYGSVQNLATVLNSATTLKGDDQSSAARSIVGNMSYEID